MFLPRTDVEKRKEIWFQILGGGGRVVFTSVIKLSMISDILACSAGRSSLMCCSTMEAYWRNSTKRLEGSTMAVSFGVTTAGSLVTDVLSFSVVGVGGGGGELTRISDWACVKAWTKFRPIFKPVHNASKLVSLSSTDRVGRADLVTVFVNWKKKPIKISEPFFFPRSPLLKFKFSTNFLFPNFDLTVENMNRQAQSPCHPRRQCLTSINQSIEQGAPSHSINQSINNLLLILLIVLINQSINRAITYYWFCW